MNIDAVCWSTTSFDLDRREGLYIPLSALLETKENLKKKDRIALVFFNQLLDTRPVVSKH